MNIAPDMSLSHWYPEGRVESLDILRGLAILLMTVTHQLLPFGLQPDALGQHLLVIGSYYTRPLFIALSGIALVLYARKYRWPFRMMVHGSVLFLMAWTVDLGSHQSLAIDWDIFQLIGACYAIAALFSYLNNHIARYAAVSILILVWYANPALRPDHGLFPIWPHGVYFLGGYVIGAWVISRYNRVWLTLLLVSASFVYLSCFYIYFERTIPLSTNVPGIVASQAAIIVLLFVTLLLEKNDFNRNALLSFLLRMGRYPLTLYFMQQLMVVLGVRLHFKLTLTGSPAFDCFAQTVLLVAAMYGMTFLFPHFRFLSMEFWLGKAEGLVMDCVPKSGVFSPRPAK